MNVFTGTVVSASSISSGCLGVEGDAVSDFFFDCDDLGVLDEDCFVLFDEVADVSGGAMMSCGRLVITKVYGTIMNMIVYSMDSLIVQVFYHKLQFITSTFKRFVIMCYLIRGESGHEWSPATQETGPDP